MSIPKEPRQLMINLMYLVLTCMLALNVSAEVLHAFFTMDKSLDESNRLVDGSNQQLVAAIGEQAEAYTQFAPFWEKTKLAQQTSKDFYDYVATLKEELVKAAGGLGEDGMPVRKADKDIPTRLLVKEDRGDILMKKTMETREKLLSLIDDEGERSRLAERIPLKINELPKGTDKKTWAQFTFQQMPVAAVMPMLTKFQSDVMAAETAILNHFAGKLDIAQIKPDKFAPVIAADKSYVIRGEEFRGEIFLAAYSSTADNIAVSVDGRPLAVRDGKAVFSTHPNSPGTSVHEMNIRLTNPLTGQTETFRKQFSYEVGDRSVAVSADKMNVFYVGVDNPVSISAAGVSSNQVVVKADGVTLTPNGQGKYMAKSQKTGRATITVYGGGLKPVTFEYRVKRIPDPVLKVGNSRGGQMPVNTFIAQQGIIPDLEGFDFDAKSEVRNFEIVRLRKGDASTAQNSGGRFGTEARRLIDNAQRGDVFYFDNVKVRNPGDQADRNLGSMVFTLK